MVKITVKIKGDKELERELRKLERAFPDAVAITLFEIAVDPIFKESQEEVPVDTGRLRSSGGVTLKSRGLLRSREAVVFYGTNYALPVHQRTEIPHTTGKARFLVDPFERAAPGILGMLVAGARRNIKAGRGPSDAKDVKGEQRERDERGRFK